MRRWVCAWAASRAICAPLVKLLKQASTMVKPGRSSINWFAPRISQCDCPQSMNLLSEIVANKQQRVDQAKHLVPLEEMRAMASEVRREARAHALLKALSDESKINIIAEFKRRSPSKGEIRCDADPLIVAGAYESAGAAAVSVLTEEDYFGGSLNDLRAVRQTVSLPILRKDFVFDEYQVYESAAAGAEAVLLIVAALDEEVLGCLR